MDDGVIDDALTATSYGSAIEPRLHRARRLPHRQDRLAVLDLHRLCRRRHQRRHRRPYGPFDTHQIAYTFDGGNGFTAAVALEEGSGVDSTRSTAYIPHVVGWRRLHPAAGVASRLSSATTRFGKSAPVKVRVDVNATEQLSLFVMAGYKSGADDDHWRDDNPNYYGVWGWRLGHLGRRHLPGHREGRLSTFSLPMTTAKLLRPSPTLPTTSFRAS